VGNEKYGGFGKMAIARLLARILVIAVVLSLKLAAILKTCNQAETYVFKMAAKLKYKITRSPHCETYLDISHLPQPDPFSLAPTFNQP
jgi:hypothetical protein